MRGTGHGSVHPTGSPRERRIALVPPAAPATVRPSGVGPRPYTLVVSKNLPILLIGLIAGLVSGLFGVGGGVIVVPGLVLFLGFSQHRASGTSSATIMASSAAALVSFGFDGSVDWGAAALVFSGAAVGAWAGARFLHRVPEVWLMRVFTLVMILSAVRLVGS